jgi:hypothetical protein
VRVLKGGLNGVGVTRRRIMFREMTHDIGKVGVTLLDLLKEMNDTSTFVSF